MSEESKYTLENCGCRESTASDPVPRNLPGLERISHRPDSHAGFRSGILASFRKDPALRALSTRDPRDPFIALADSAAAMCDMVAFYQDQLANEHYLSTAGEPRAIEDLAAQIGYIPNPALGAETLLSYTLTDAPGSPNPVLVPAGSASMSQPEGDDSPQQFETDNDLEARIEWNAFSARTTETQSLRAGLDALWLQGTALNLKPGDRLLIQRNALGSADSHTIARISKVKEDTGNQRTEVLLLNPLPSAFDLSPADGFPVIVAFRLRAAVFGSTAPDWRSLPASMKREVLGLAEDEEIPADKKLEWPNFHIHLPRPGVLSQVPPLIYEMVSTPESMVQAVKGTVDARAQAARAGAESEIASLGMSGATSGMSLLNTGARTATTLFQASAQALSDTASDVSDLPSRANAFLQSLLGGLKDVLQINIDFPDTDTDSDANALDQLASLLRGITSGGITLNPGNVAADSFGQDLENLVRSTPLGWPLRLREKLDTPVPGEDRTFGQRLADQAGVSLASVDDTAGRVERSFRSSLDLGIAAQAKALVDAAMDAALQAPVPDQFASRKGFVAFVGMTTARFLTLPFRLNDPQAILDALLNPGEVDPEGIPQYLAPDRFEPGQFHAEDFKDRSVTSEELAVVAMALGYLPPAVAVPLMTFSGLADLVSANEAELYSLKIHDEIADTLEAAMQSQKEAAPTLAALASGYDPATLSLDAAYSVIVPGSKVLLGVNGAYEPFEVASSEERARADFGISGKSTILTLTPTDLSAWHDKVRELVVLAQSEPLVLARRPIDSAVTGRMIEIDASVTAIPPGRELVVTGQGKVDGEAHEIPVITDFHEPGNDARLHLTVPLPVALLRDTVEILGNIVPASQGQSTFEIMGSGDPAIGFQSFVLKSVPVSQYAAATSEGVASSLRIEVDRQEWTRVRTFYGQPSDARIYVAREDANGATHVIFGDGRTGQRLPRGINNVVARYRHGAGTSGNMGSGRIKAPVDLPSGVQGVSNPVASTGGSNRQSAEQTRSVAPLPTRALGRIVSLPDHENWLLAYPGIAKARAESIWHAGTETIALTVAGDAGAAILPGSSLHDSLVGAMNSARYGRRPFALLSYRDLRFRLRAKLQPAPGFTFEEAASVAGEAIHGAYGFDARRIGEPVFASHIIALLQAQAPISGVDLDRLSLDLPPAGAPLLSRVLIAEGATPSPSGITAGALLTVSDADDAVEFEPYHAS